MRELVDLVGREALDDGTREELLSYLSRLVELLAVMGEDIERFSRQFIADIPVDVQAPLSVDVAYATANDVFKLASKPTCGLEEFLIWVNAGIGYLSKPDVQHLLLARAGLGPALATLVRSCRILPSPSQVIDPSFSASATDIPDPALEDRELLREIQTKLVDVLSEISALPDFPITYPLFSPLVNSLQLWLDHPQPHLQGCACIMLGNLARANEVCKTMVRVIRLHEKVVDILKEASEPYALYAAVGFLKNLALPMENRGIVGESGVIELLPRLWAMEKVPELQYAGVALTRRLAIACFPTVRRLLQPLSSDPDSPAHSHTFISSLLKLWETSHEMGTRTEIGRLITAVLRVLNSTQPDAADGEEDALRSRLFRLHGELSRPLAMLVTQTQYPILQSEGWFTLALLSRTADGAALASEITADIDVLIPLSKLVTGSRPLESTDASVQQGQHLAEPMDVAGSDVVLAQRPSGEVVRQDVGEGDEETRTRMSQDMTVANKTNAIILISNLLQFQVSLSLHFSPESGFLSYRAQFPSPHLERYADVASNRVRRCLLYVARSSVISSMDVI